MAAFRVAQDLKEFEYVALTLLEVLYACTSKIEKLRILLTVEETLVQEILLPWLPTWKEAVCM